MKSGGYQAIAGGRNVKTRPAKIGKVMKEFKMGNLRSGSKKGPKVTSPKQAKAIAMSEAGMDRKKRGRSDKSMLMGKRL